MNPKRARILVAGTIAASAIGIAVVTSPTPPAPAPGFYASPSGSGTACTNASPCSLQSGIAKLAGGDKLNLHGGTYNVTDAWFNPLPSGTSTNPTEVRSVTGETPVLDGGCPLNGPRGALWCSTGGSNGELWLPNGKSYITLGPGITMQHFDNCFGNGVITPGSSDHLRITGDTFTYNGADWPQCNGDGAPRVENDHDVYMAGGACGANHDIMIDHNWMGNSPGGALHMYHYCQGANIDFQNNIVVNHSTGVFICDSAENIRIVNNTFIGTWRRASITTYCGEQTGPTSAIIRNNIFIRSDGGTQWEKPSGQTGMTEDHNIWYGGTAPGTGTGDLTSNPQLDANYVPQFGSSAIDAGSSTGAPANDYAYAPRPQGNGIDIGAYETGGAAPSGDETAPTPPTNLVATGPSCTTGSCTIHVTFTPATDNVGVTGYNLYRPLGTLVGTDVGSATSTDYGGSLPTCSTQTMGLSAVDAAGNESTVASVTGETYCP